LWRKEKKLLLGINEKKATTVVAIVDEQEKELLLKTKNKRVIMCLIGSTKRE
jgi:hypothetical protein